MGLVDYISRHPNQKAEKVSAYDDKIIFAKLGLISASVNSVKLTSSQSALHLHKIPHCESQLLVNQSRNSWHWFQHKWILHISCKAEAMSKYQL